jgi:hypothetical protein
MNGRSPFAIKRSDASDLARYSKITESLENRLILPRQNSAYDHLRCPSRSSGGGRPHLSEPRADERPRGAYNRVISRFRAAAQR